MDNLVVIILNSNLHCGTEVATEVNIKKSFMVFMCVFSVVDHRQYLHNPPSALASNVALYTKKKIVLTEPLIVR